MLNPYHTITLSNILLLECRVVCVLSDHARMLVAIFPFPKCPPTLYCRCASYPLHSRPRVRVCACVRARVSVRACVRVRVRVCVCVCVCWGGVRVCGGGGGCGCVAHIWT